MYIPNIKQYVYMKPRNFQCFFLRIENGINLHKAWSKVIKKNHATFQNSTCFISEFKLHKTFLNPRSFEFMVNNY